MVAVLIDPLTSQFTSGPVDEASARARVVVTGELWGHFAICERDQDCMIGSVSLSQRRGPWEVSFSLQSPYWGRGYATEALTLAVDWFFDDTGASELIAMTQTANERSRRLLDRAGAAMIEESTYKGLPQLIYAFRHPNCPPISGSSAV